MASMAMVAMLMKPGVEQPCQLSSYSKTLPKDGQYLMHGLAFVQASI